MPRVYDYTRSVTESGSAIINPVRYGRGEIPAEEMSQPDGCVEYCARNCQFSAGFGYPHPMDARADWKKVQDWAQGIQRQMDSVHEWLSQNITHPWHWSEGWSNNGHNLDTHIHIERRCDQQLFRDTWGDLFKFRADSENDIEELAVIKGVVEPQVKFFKWLTDHSGITVVDVDKSQTPELYTFAFSYPELERAFKKDWGDKYAHDPASGTYTGKWYSNMRDFSKDMGCWLNNRGAFNTVGQGGEWQIKVLYPEAVELFVKHWGRHFGKIIGPAADGLPVLAGNVPELAVFVGKPPEMKPRKIPQAFLDYLDGKCDFSSVKVVNPWPVKKPALSGNVLPAPKAP